MILQAFGAWLGFNLFLGSTLAGLFSRRHNQEVKTAQFMVPHRGDFVWAKFPHGPAFRVLVVAKPRDGVVSCRTDDLCLDQLDLPVSTIKGFCLERDARRA